MINPGEDGGASPFIVEISEGDRGQWPNGAGVIDVSKRKSALESDSRVWIVGKREQFSGKNSRSGQTRFGKLDGMFADARIFVVQRAFCFVFGQSAQSF